MPAKKPQDHKPPFELDLGSDAEPWRVKVAGKTYELPGEVPFGIVQIASDAQRDGTDDEAAGMLMMSEFLDLCPEGLRVALRRAGAGKTAALFKAWTEAVGLGESSPS